MGMLEIKSRKVFILTFWAFPLISYVVALMQWLWFVEPESYEGVLFHWILFIMLFVFSYDIGFKKYYKKGARLYFYMSYLIPMIISSLGLIFLYVSLITI